MALRYLQEVTDWGDRDLPNHIYIMDGRTNVGYIRSKDGLKIIYNTPSKLFSRTRRKFKEIKNYGK